MVPIYHGISADMCCRSFGWAAHLDGRIDPAINMDPTQLRNSLPFVKFGARIPQPCALFSRGKKRTSAQTHVFERNGMLL